MAEETKKSDVPGLITAIGTVVGILLTVLQSAFPQSPQGIQIVAFLLLAAAGSYVLLQLGKFVIRDLRPILIRRRQKRSAQEFAERLLALVKRFQSEMTRDRDDNFFYWMGRGAITLNSGGSLPTSTTLTGLYTLDRMILSAIIRWLENARVGPEDVQMCHMVLTGAIDTVMDHYRYLWLPLFRANWPSFSDTTRSSLKICHQRLDEFVRAFLDFQDQIPRTLQGVIGRQHVVRPDPLP